jgi:hypothetical protein
MSKHMFTIERRMDHGDKRKDLKVDADGYRLLGHFVEFYDFVGSGRVELVKLVVASEDIHVIHVDL